MRWRDDGDRSFGHRPPDGLLFHGPEMAGKGAEQQQEEAAVSSGSIAHLADLGRSWPPKTNFWGLTWTEMGQKWTEMDKNDPKT